MALLHSFHEPGLVQNVWASCVSGEFSVTWSMHANLWNMLTYVFPLHSLFRHIPLLGFECIRRNDQVVGFLRRGEFGYYLNKSLGYGYVSHPNGDVITNEFLAEGDYTIERMGEVYKAKIHLKSPFDPQNKRLKGIYEWKTYIFKYLLT